MFPWTKLHPTWFTCNIRQKKGKSMLGSPSHVPHTQIYCAPLWWQRHLTFATEHVVCLVHSIGRKRVSQAHEFSVILCWLLARYRALALDMTSTCFCMATCCFQLLRCMLFINRVLVCILPRSLCNIVGFSLIMDRATFLGLMTGLILVPPA